MQSFFLNPWMLLGLAGMALPVLVHLLSRKKYDVVLWGAMQFLQPGRNARRRIRIEELLLMLLRIGLIVVLVIALARPWFSGSLAGRLTSRPDSDIVLVIDSSYSTDHRGMARTPHQAGLAWCRDLLKESGPGDSIGVVDVRSQVRTIGSGLSVDRRFLNDALESLPAPSGTSRLREGILRGLQMAALGTHASRHLVVVTDGQALPWQSADERFWLQLEELQRQSTVPVDLWLVNTQKQKARPANDSLDRLQLSRELTVVDFPVRIRTRLKNTGGRASSSRKAFLEVDGQRLAEAVQTVRLEPEGQATIEFEHRFATTGSHVVRVVVDEDQLPVDDRAAAVVAVTEALPVLLVDGSPSPQAVRSETFFARSALSAAGNRTPWVAARTVNWTAFRRESLGNAQVLLLANVPRLSDSQLAVVREFVEAGGGLAVTLGDQIDSDWYSRQFFAGGAGLLPARPESQQQASLARDAAPVTIQSDSLLLPWISRFQAGGDVGFLEARYTGWFRLSFEAPAVAASSSTPPAGSLPSADPEPARPPAVVAARLTGGDPLLVSRRFGRGEVALLASTIDADWNTLPARPDYVAFLHELVFQLASGRIARNVDAGTPLTFPIPAADQADAFVMSTPDGGEQPVTAAGDAGRALIRFDHTIEPGIYRLKPRTDAAARGAAGPQRDEAFCVEFDRSESDLTPLTDERFAELTQSGRFRAIDNPQDLLQALRTDSARFEFWHLLLLVFLGILIGEVVMTRRLVQGGHFYEPEEA